MAAVSDKEQLVERDANNGTFLRILACLSVVFITLFLSVTFLVLLKLQDIGDQDADMHLQIEEFKRMLELTQNGGDDDAASRDVITTMVDRYVDEINELQDNSQRHKRQTSNIFELILKAQEATFEKYCMPHNATCPQGYRGENGTVGLPGSLGTIGAVGLSGDKGVTGDPGISGFKGDEGFKGITGDVGPVGNIGQDGDNGTIGETGLKGAQGLNGTTGSQGKPGMKGDIGDTGQNGTDGTDGVQGRPGFSGIRGDKGANGTQGPIGPAGTSTQLPNDCQCYKKPTFLNPLDETMLASSTTNAVFPCDSTGNPPPVVTLFKAPKKSGRKRAVQQSGNTFTLVKAVPFDYGKYVCTATNMYGSVSKSVTVVKPPVN